MEEPKSTLLDALSDEASWRSFLQYKESLACPKTVVKEIQAFLDGRAFLVPAAMIREGRALPYPKKSVISKLGSAKKRTVYTYPNDLNLVMKLLTFLILRKYDHLFSGGLYSFRPGRNAKDAVRKLIRTRNIRQKFYYKVDIHDYFNSIPVEQLLPMVKDALADDPELYRFLENVLTDPHVIFNGEITEERKGIMAGTPLSSFFANLYLKEMDERFVFGNIPYARYSDDVIVFADTQEEAKAHRDFILSFLAERGLTVNPDKEQFGSAADGWTFLGFSYRDGEVDIAEATLKKLKQKMRRKRDGLARWQKRNGVAREKAAAAFIRIFNRKLMEGPKDSELTWSYWFFPVINTTKSLSKIDHYAEDCIRYLLSGTHTKARFNVRYEDIKALGYRSLLHEYYAYEKTCKKEMDLI
ncbi:MAG: group II intron reverse transcriptase domain-containing protein [Lachnospiraceae bacterium]|nr:group II intron reverse transcriptase domain-containing protein [Lachnospiraceae bacterium]MBR4767959.1 group II intron reverse transcriptase domain-containing protein [Lachnospiraceae bacterium]